MSTTVRKVLTGALVLALIATVIGAVLWPGLDTQKPTRTDPTIWALATASNRYGRVNLDIAELETVRGIDRPAALTAQTRNAALVFPQGGTRAAVIDGANPVHLADAALEGLANFTGAVDVVAAGNFFAFLTDAGGVYAGNINNPAHTIRADGQRPGDEDADPFVATAVALADSGLVTAYSASTSQILQLDLSPSGAQPTITNVPNGPTAGQTSVTSFGNHWAVLSGNSLWLSALDIPVTLPGDDGGVLQRASSSGDSLFLATPTSLFEVSPLGAVSLAASALEAGVPTQPARGPDGTMHAAWLTQGAVGGTLWNSTGTEPIRLDYGGTALISEPAPRFVISEDRIALNDTTTGWVWLVPTGRLVPSSQHWDRVDPEHADRDDDAATIREANEPLPPVAVADAFGVRAGTMSVLPVLLNDFDPNDDVLTIDAASLTGLDPAFGELSVTDDGQRIVFAANPTASGTATFTYTVTDGSAVDGRRSDPAPVTLTVYEPTSNAGPQWCADAVAGCQMTWPSPQVAPGGTIEVPVLDAWVDPQSDGLLLMGAAVTTGSGRAAFTPEGNVVYRHENPTGGDETVVIALTVADTFGATTNKDLVVAVAGEPRIEAANFAVTARAGESVNVDVTPFVTGTAGRARLSEVLLGDAATATATQVGATTFDFRAETPGTYIVSYSVTDGHSQAHALVRVTVVDPNTTELTTGPVTILVRPGSDITVDVLNAVHNPGGAVLLLTDVEHQAAEGASLLVDTVGSHLLRVSGTTADALPGRLGTITYTVTDGVGAAGGSVRGEATVFLLPDVIDAVPVAVDDVVTVRAGAQIDVPVTANDVSLSGAPVTLDPRSVRASSDALLAFGSGNTLRILAPMVAGDYRVQYSVFADGDPSLYDTAWVTVHVIGTDQANRPPRPPELLGRVVAGETVRIPFDALGVDPDGDPVRLSAIATQPERGSARISSDGRSIVFSSVSGDSGQRTFTYEVDDGRGARAVGTVRVGVLAAEINPTPITFTDFAQIGVGSPEPVRIDVLSNDIDPTGGTLQIIAVEPNVPTGTSEYERLAALIRNGSEIAAGTAELVEIAAPDEPGRLSFRYTVANEAGNVGIGVIVLRVVRSEVPNFPTVTDTILTAATRDDFREGVDVITGRANWPGGDLNNLDLSLWTGDGGVLAGGVAVDGNSLRGDLGDEERLIPFVLRGGGATDAADGSAAAETFGFLIIPHAAALVPEARPDAPPVVVDEGESVTFDMFDQVAVPTGRVLEVLNATASGARSAGQCVQLAGGIIEYRAGFGAPWTDNCLVTVQFDGQNASTVIPVPILVTPYEPQPELTAAALTVVPADTIDFDLASMVNWPGDRVGAAAPIFTVTGSGENLTMVQAGTQLSFEATEMAVPGNVATFQVGIENYDDVPTAPLTVRIGPWPDGMPTGGNVVTTCRESDTTCIVNVIGAPGETNSRPGALLLHSVDATGSCNGLTFARVDDSSISITAAPGAPGGTCSTTFSVITDTSDPAIGTGANSGTLTVDFQALPLEAAGVVQSAFSATTITLQVTPGAASRSYPALEGFVVTSGGSEVASCSASGECSPITSVIGQMRQFDVFSLNAVGRSLLSVNTGDAWAFAPPTAPVLSEITPVPNGDIGMSGRAEVSGLDVTTSAIDVIVSEPFSETTIPVAMGQGSVPLNLEISNGGAEVTVRPVSRYRPPEHAVGPDGTNADNSVSRTGFGLGAPPTPDLRASALLPAPNWETATFTLETTLNSVSAPGVGHHPDATLRLGFGTPGNCSPTGTATTTGIMTANFGEPETFIVCAGTYIGDTNFGISESQPLTVEFDELPDASGFAYEVDPNPNMIGSTGAYWGLLGGQGGRYPWLILPANPPGWVNRLVAGHEGWGDTFRAWVQFRHGWHWRDFPVTNQIGRRPVRINSVVNTGQCVIGQPLSFGANMEGGGATPTLSLHHATAVLHDGTRVNLSGTQPIPYNTDYLTNIEVTAAWPAWGLHSATLTVADLIGCPPPTPPDPGPDPEGPGPEEPGPEGPGPEGPGPVDPPDPGGGEPGTD